MIPMRLAIFTETMPPAVNGVTHTLMHVVNSFMKNDIATAIVAPGNEQNAGPFGHRVSFISMPHMPAPFYPGVNIAIASEQARRILDTFRPNIVHLVDPLINGYFGL